jgi:hypothetical protein
MRAHVWLALASTAALALSFAYIELYLRGGPRIIDATSYYLEARSIAAGSFQFAVPDPAGSYRGRFLLEGPDGRLGVIFPPGYPLVLALGFVLGRPMWVGPVVGALLVIATFALGRAVTRRNDVALLAAGLSATCAALRYHTADTMSHGFAALLFTTTLAAAALPTTLARLGAGACLGWLIATRPVSAAVALGLVLLLQRPRTLRAVTALLLPALPGVGVLFWHQHALTGDWFASTQLAYYARADGPPDCFRYGFGDGIGCRFEHGEYVREHLPDGYGVSAALRNFAMRLAWFSMDATNTVPLTLLAGFSALRLKSRELGVLGASVLLQALAYAPFYFDGSYPGAGARFLSEVIPCAQVLVARAALELRFGAFVIPASLAGFLLHARSGHEELREREGGRPMFEREVAAKAGATRGLLLMDTDHGFNLAFDPGVEDPRTGLMVARYRSGAHDVELHERLGRPPSFLYRYSLRGEHLPRVERFRPAASARWEAEAEWPARTAGKGAYPLHVPCASSGRALRLFAGGEVTVPLANSAASAPQLLVGWAATTASGAKLRVWTPGQWLPHWVSAPGPGCTHWLLPMGTSSTPRATVRVRLEAGEGALDFIEAADPPASAGVTR